MKKFLTAFMLVSAGVIAGGVVSKYTPNIFPLSYYLLATASVAILIERYAELRSKKSK